MKGWYRELGALRVETDCPGPFRVLLARKGTAPGLECGEAGLVIPLLSWLVQVPTYLPDCLKSTQLEFYLPVKRGASFV